jgi:hypothetical protein
MEGSLMCHRHWGLRFARANDSNMPEDDESDPYAHLPGTDVPGEGFWEGYSDVMADRPFDPDFSAEPGTQQAYEDGRELAARLLAHGYRIAWPNCLVLPPALVAAAKRTA